MHGCLSKRLGQEQAHQADLDQAASGARGTLRLPSLQEQHEQPVGSPTPTVLSTTVAAAAGGRPKAGIVCTAVAKLDSDRVVRAEALPPAQSTMLDAVEWEVTVAAHVSQTDDQRDMDGHVGGTTWIRYPPRVAQVIERAYQRQKTHSGSEGSTVQVFFSSA